MLQVVNSEVKRTIYATFEKCSLKRPKMSLYFTVLSFAVPVVTISLHFTSTQQ